MRQRYLFLFIGGFVAGVWFRSFFNFGWSLPLFFILLGIVFIILAFVFKNDEGKIFVLVSVFLLATGLGVARFEFKESGRSLALDSFVGQEVLMEGNIIGESDQRENHTKLSFLPEKINDQGIKNTGKILVISEHFPEFKYGDKLLISGQLLAPENFQIDESRDFDYVSYLAKEGIYYQMFYPEMNFISSGHGFFLKHWLFAFKNAFLEKLSRVIPEPQVSLMGGLVVGAKRAMGQELLDDFRDTGLIHIVVLSGYNVTIIVNSMIKTLSYISRTAGFGLGIIGIILFALMTGAGPTIIRASIMAVLATIARWTGRRYEITIALFIAGFLMVLQNPKVLVFDVGFQLSFIATLGLIYLAPIIERKLKFITERWGLRELTTATISAQIFVLPWLLYKIGNLSLVALPVNLLVLAVVPFTMFFGFLTGVVGFISTILSYPFGWVSHFLLSYILLVVKLFSSLNFSSFDLAKFPLVLTILIYVSYWFFIKRFSPKTPKK